MNDFERESSTMDMKEEMMSDAVDDAMEDEDEGEGEEVESDKILKEVLDEIGMNMNESVSDFILCSLSRILRFEPIDWTTLTFFLNPKTAHICADRFSASSGTIANFSSGRCRGFTFVSACWRSNKCWQWRSRG